MDSNDPRWVYEMTDAQAHRAWPCKICRVRRDEHADQPEKSAFPSLDITDHQFIEARDTIKRIVPARWLGIPFYRVLNGSVLVSQHLTYRSAKKALGN